MKLISKLVKMIISVGPNGEEASIAYGGIAQVSRQVEALRQSTYHAPVEESDVVLAKRLISIAATYGFRYTGHLGGGSFHFRRNGGGLVEYLRTYLDDWPEGAVMFLEADSMLCGGMSSKDFGLTIPTSSNWEESITPREHVVTKFVELLEKAEKIRAWNDGLTDYCSAQ